MPSLTPQQLSSLQSPQRPGESPGLQLHSASLGHATVRFGLIIGAAFGARWLNILHEREFTIVLGLLALPTDVISSAIRAKLKGD